MQPFRRVAVARPPPAAFPRFQRQPLVKQPISFTGSTPYIHAALMFPVAAAKGEERLFGKREPQVGTNEVPIEPSEDEKPQ